MKTLTVWFMAMSPASVIVHGLGKFLHVIYKNDFVTHSSLVKGIKMFELISFLYLFNISIYSQS